MSLGWFLISLTSMALGLGLIVTALAVYDRMNAKGKFYGGRRGFEVQLPQADNRRDDVK